MQWLVAPQALWRNRTCSAASGSVQTSRTRMYVKEHRSSYTCMATRLPLQRRHTCPCFLYACNRWQIATGNLAPAYLDGNASCSSLSLGMTNVTRFLVLASRNGWTAYAMQHAQDQLAGVWHQQTSQNPDTYTCTFCTKLNCWRMASRMTYTCITAQCSDTMHRW